MDEATTTLEFRTNGRATGPVSLALADIVTLPKKYKGGGPYVYVATRAHCKCALAVHPLGHDVKAAGRVVAEWGKAGWMVRTISKLIVELVVCSHEPSENDEPLVYVAEKYCGCCVGVQPPIPGGEAGVAKVLQVWAEQGYYIQSIPLSQVHIEAECPHEPPKETQQMLPGLASADMEGLDDD